MLCEDIKIRSSGGGEFDCYLATPDAKGKLPAIVLASAVPSRMKNVEVHIFPACSTAT